MLPTFAVRRTRTRPPRNSAARPSAASSETGGGEDDAANLVPSDLQAGQCLEQVGRTNKIAFQICQTQPGTVNGDQEPNTPSEPYPAGKDKPLEEEAHVVGGSERSVPAIVQAATPITSMRPRRKAAERVSLITAAIVALGRAADRGERTERQGRAARVAPRQCPNTVSTVPGRRLGAPQIPGMMAF